MKRFFSLLTLLVAVVTMGGYVHAQTTYEISENCDTKPAKGDASPWTFITKNKTFKITYTDPKPDSPKYYASGDKSVLKGSFKCSNGYVYTLTIPDDLTISKIKFDGYSNKKNSDTYLKFNDVEKKDDTFGYKTVKSYSYDWPSNSKSITFQACNGESVFIITLIESVNTNKLKAPTITYTEAGLVTITPANGETPKEIRYTTDNTDPSATVGEVYLSPFNAAGKTVKAVSIANEGMGDSDIATVEVPKAVQSTKVDLTQVTVAGTPIETSELEYLIANKTLTLSKTYTVAPAVVFTKTTTTTYTDASTSSESDDINATVTKGTDNFVATATIGETEYTINLPLNKTASITSDVTSFDFSVKRADVATKAIKFTAVNTSGIVKITAPNVEGLSTSLSKQPEEGETDVTIADGETVTLAVKYMPETVVAKTSDKITIAVGETTLDIPFTYEDTEDMIKTIKDVTGDMAWDFSTKVTNTITSSRPDMVPFANFEGFPEGLDYQYLKATNDLYRKEGYYQGVQIAFHTTVAGHVKIELTNPNSKETRTAMIVNGDDKIVSNNTGIIGGKEKIYAEADVKAGDVIIKGYVLKDQNGNVPADPDKAFNHIRIYNIEFTAAKTTTVKVSDAKMATYCNTSAWVVPSDLEVYTAKYADSKITLNKVAEGTVVPAKEGVVLYGEPKTYTLNLSTEEGTKLADNDLIGATEKTTMNNNTTYILVKDKATQKVMFGQLASGQEVKANSAYLTINDINAAKSISIDFGGTTGINTIDNAANAKDGEYYTLSGQRTMKPVKGIYILNGKKFIAK